MSAFFIRRYHEASSFLDAFVDDGPTLHAASAGTLDVSGVLSWTPDGSNFDYSIKLTNSSSSTDSLKTFWYAWVPGADFLPTSPLSVSNPAGWTDTITHFPDVPTNGYAIQYVTTSDPVLPGESRIFGFTSADTPAQLSGDSPFYPGTPVGTSFVYQGAPFQGDSLQFPVQSVPEPASLTLAMLSVLGTFAAAGRQWLKRSR